MSTSRVKRPKAAKRKVIEPATPPPKKAASVDDGRKRCSWCGTDPEYIRYHDKEWGVPVHDDRHLFEMLCLEGAQAGLSWITILRKRENYRRAFDNFDATKMARYTPAKEQRLLLDPGIVRNRLKVHAFVLNARAFLETQASHGSFDRYIWQFAPATKGRAGPHSRGDFVVSSPESDALSKDLKRRGFKFNGTTICYAFMQAVGLVNDHQKGCWRAKG